MGAVTAKLKKLLDSKAARGFQGLANRTVGLALILAVLWIVQGFFAPKWLVSSVNGIQTALQVVPAAIVSLFVLMLGSILVIAQQSATAHGTRAPFMVASDQRTKQLIARPLLVSVIAIVLSGTVPAADPPTAWLSAGTATLIIGTVLLYSLAGLQLLSLFLTFSAPVNYGKASLIGVAAALERNKTGLVVFRVGLLGEMLRANLRRGDGTGATAALNAMQRLIEMYFAVSAWNPQCRTHNYDSGPTVGWIGGEVSSATTRAGAEVLSLDESEEHLVAICYTLRLLGERAIASGAQEESESAVNALMELGTCVQQLRGGGLVNCCAPATDELCALERLSMEKGDESSAVKALTGWLLIVGYRIGHLGIPEHMATTGARLLSGSPQLGRAAELVRTDEFQRRWKNKLMYPQSFLQRAFVICEEAARIQQY